MRRVRFRDPSGAIRNGTWNDEIRFADSTYSENAVDILAPVEPSKIVCIGLNYADHAEESNSEIPDRPLLFLKPPNTVASHGDDVTLLSDKDELEWEAELGVVIGEQCRNVPRNKAKEVISGFTCVNDISNRDDQRIERNWVRGKAFDGAAPIGPVVADTEDVPDDARITLRVNGQTKQKSSRSQLIFPVDELIEEITTYMTLEEGDVISTGTPAGVGPLSDGDSIEIEIEGIGTLKHSVRIP
jgi:2-keto-4-pentenoate hydratase/2-oxohepta-3-ene-1,7-dioic acid hydratase in catechol pathway